MSDLSTRIAKRDEVLAAKLARFRAPKTISVSPNSEEIFARSSGETRLRSYVFQPYTMVKTIAQAMKPAM